MKILTWMWVKSLPDMKAHSIQTDSRAANFSDAQQLRNLCSGLRYMTVLSSLIFANFDSAAAFATDEKIAGAQQLYSVVQHGDLSDAQFVAKALALRKVKTKADGQIRHEPDPATSLFRGASITYSILPSVTGGKNGARLTIVSPNLCIEFPTLLSVFGSTNRVYRSATKAEQIRETDLIYQAKFPNHTISAIFLYLPGQPCLVSALLQQYGNTEQNGKAQQIGKSKKFPQRLSREQQLNHFQRIFEILNHDELLDMQFVQTAMDIPLQESRYGYEPYNASYHFRGPQLDYRHKDKFVVNMRISYNPTKSCLDIDLVPAVFGAPHEDGRQLLLFNDSPFHEGDPRYLRYRYVRNYKTILTFDSMDGCLNYVSLEQRPRNPNKPN